MNFLQIILGKSSDLRSVSVTDIDTDDLRGLIERNSAVVIYGNGQKLLRFCKELKKLNGGSNYIIKKFAFLGENVKNIVTATPLDSRKTLNSALIHLGLSRGKVLKPRIIIALLRVFNFPVLYPLIFRKQFCIAFDPKKETIFSFISEKLKISPENISFSAYKNFRKLVLPTFNLETGEAIAYAKVYASKETIGHYGENEVRALRFLDGFTLERAAPPRLLSNDYFKNHLVVILSTKSGLKTFEGVSGAHINWVKELAEKTGQRKVFKSSLFAQAIEEGMELIGNKLKKEDFEAVKYFYKKAKDALWEKEFLFSFTNGEFTRFGLFWHKDKNMVIDWELARDEFPPIFDVYNLLISYGPHKRGGYVEIYLRNLETMFFKKNNKTKATLGKVLHWWQISREEAYFYFILFLIDQLYTGLYLNAHRLVEKVVNVFRCMYNKNSRYKKNWLNYD